MDNHNEKVLLQEPYIFRLLKVDDVYKMEVEVGGSAVYTLVFYLNSEEQDKFNKHGDSYIKELAKKVAKNESAYVDRAINR